MVRHIAPRARANYDDAPTMDGVPRVRGARGRNTRRSSLTKTGKCDHERTHVDEDGVRCLFCAAWIEQNG